MILPLKNVVIGLPWHPNRGAKTESRTPPLTRKLTIPQSSESFKMFKKECVLSRRTYICLANKSSISPGSKSKVKSSVQRAIRTQLVTTYPLLAPHIDEIIPKKEQLDAMKMYITLYARILFSGHFVRRKDPHASDHKEHR
jgi:hypothetical protein